MVIGLLTDLACVISSTFLALGKKCKHFLRSFLKLPQAMTKGQADWLLKS